MGIRTTERQEKLQEDFIAREMPCGNCNNKAICKYSDLPRFDYPRDIFNVSISCRCHNPAWDEVEEETDKDLMSDFVPKKRKKTPSDTIYIEKGY